MAGKLGRHFFGGDEQFGAAVLLGDDIGKRDGRMRDIAATNVEQPRDRIERRNHDCVEIVFGEPVGDFGALFGLRARGNGLIGPDRVDRVACRGHHFDALGFDDFLQRFDPGPGVQPWIVSDFRAVSGFSGKPFAEAVIGDVAIFEQVLVHLVLHLHGVAPVDENRGVIASHGGKACRPAESGQPVQALRIVADIFAHVLVGNRDDKPVEIAALEFFAKGLQAGLMGLHQHSVDSLCSRGHLPRSSVRL